MEATTWSSLTASLYSQKSSGKCKKIFTGILYAINYYRFTLTSILVGFNDQHQCYAQVLLRYYLFSLMAVQLLSCLIQLAVILVSARGTITDPRPRWSIKWIIYLHTVIFAVEFLWESVGVVWVFDPSISCASSHFVLTLTRLILIWNVAASVLTALYMFLRTSLQKLCSCNPKYKRLSSARSFGGRRLSKLSSRSLERYKRRRRWFWVFQILFYCFRSSKSPGNVLREVSLTLSDAFEKFRGYVPSDILAGLLLVKIKHKERRDDKERSDEVHVGEREREREREKGGIIMSAFFILLLIAGKRERMHITAIKGGTVHLIMYTFLMLSHTYTFISIIFNILLFRLQIITLRRLYTITILHWVAMVGCCTSTPKDSWVSCSFYGHLYADGKIKRSCKILYSRGPWVKSLPRGPDNV